MQLGLRPCSTSYLSRSQTAAKSRLDSCPLYAADSRKSNDNRDAFHEHGRLSSQIFPRERYPLDGTCSPQGHNEQARSLSPQFDGLMH